MSGINRYYYLERKRRGQSVAKEAPIKDVLTVFLKKYHIDCNLYEQDVIDCFKELCGPTIAKFVTNIYLKGQSLYVVVALPSVRAELSMVRDALRDTINRKLEKEILKKIIIK